MKHSVHLFHWNPASKCPSIHKPLLDHRLIFEWVRSILGTIANSPKIDSWIHFFDAQFKWNTIWTETRDLLDCILTVPPSDSYDYHRNQTSSWHHQETVMNGYCSLSFLNQVFKKASSFVCTHFFSVDSHEQLSLHDLLIGRHSLNRLVEQPSIETSQYWFPRQQ